MAMPYDQGTRKLLRHRRSINLKQEQRNVKAHIHQTTICLFRIMWKKQTLIFSAGRLHVNIIATYARLLNHSLDKYLLSIHYSICTVIGAWIRGSSAGISWRVRWPPRDNGVSPTSWCQHSSMYQWRENVRNGEIL